MIETKSDVPITVKKHDVITVHVRVASETQTRIIAECDSYPH